MRLMPGLSVPQKIKTQPLRNISCFTPQKFNTQPDENYSIRQPNPLRNQMLKFRNMFLFDKLALQNHKKTLFHESTKQDDGKRKSIITALKFQIDIRRLESRNKSRSKSRSLIERLHTSTESQKKTTIFRNNLFRAKQDPLPSIRAWETNDK
ncbi:hypothetical protein pb186bvf_015441 [Paramecium bursaria]